MKSAEDWARDIVDPGGANDFEGLMPEEQVKVIADAIRQARREGAEAMRERAAMMVGRQAGPLDLTKRQETMLQDRIRALPLEEGESK